MATRSPNGRKDGAAQRIFNVALDGKPECALNLAVYVFDRGGRLAAVASVGDPGPDGYTRSSAGVFTKSIPVSTLLNGAGTSCTSAAFAEGLYVNALATDGYGEINAFDRSDRKAFGLTPAS